MKICPLGAELLHADEQTETDRHDEANSRYSQFCTYTCKRISNLKLQVTVNSGLLTYFVLIITQAFLLDTEPPTQLTQHCYMTEGTQ